MKPCRPSSGETLPGKAGHRIAQPQETTAITGLGGHGSPSQVLALEELDPKTRGSILGRIEPARVDGRAGGMYPTPRFVDHLHGVSEPGAEGIEGGRHPVWVHGGAASTAELEDVGRRADEGDAAQFGGVEGENPVVGQQHRRFGRRPVGDAASSRIVLATLGHIVDPPGERAGADHEPQDSTD